MQKVNGCSSACLMYKVHYTSLTEERLDYSYLKQKISSDNILPRGHTQTDSTLETRGHTQTDSALKTRGHNQTDSAKDKRA